MLQHRRQSLALGLLGTFLLAACSRQAHPQPVGSGPSGAGASSPYTTSSATTAGRDKVQKPPDAVPPGQPGTGAPTPGQDENYAKVAGLLAKAYDVNQPGGEREGAWQAALAELSALLKSPCLGQAPVLVDRLPGIRLFDAPAQRIRVIAISGPPDLTGSLERFQSWIQWCSADGSPGLQVIDEPGPVQFRDARTMMENGRHYVLMVTSNRAERILYISPLSLQENTWKYVDTAFAPTEGQLGILSYTARGTTLAFDYPLEQDVPQVRLGPEARSFEVCESGGSCLKAKWRNGRYELSD